jgi:hypothetical protein
MASLQVLGVIFLQGDHGRAGLGKNVDHLQIS